MGVTQLDVKQIAEEVKLRSEPFRKLLEQMHRVIVWQDDLLHKMLISLLCNGHALIEGVPGLAKTTAVACLAEGINTGFQRLQFTPDLLPADLIGTQIYRPHDGTFAVQKGPIFSNIILADEINRTTPRTQTALLEAMNEATVSIDGSSFTLEQPFMVIATQNPYEYEGTYLLPENQLDRFLMRTRLGYPSPEVEAKVLERRPADSALPGREPGMSRDVGIELQRHVDEVCVGASRMDYVSWSAAARRAQGGGQCAAGCPCREFRGGWSRRPWRWARGATSWR